MLILNKLNLLKVEEIIKLQQLKCYFKYTNDLLPCYFSKQNEKHMIKIYLKLNKKIYVDTQYPLAALHLVQIVLL